MGSSLGQEWDPEEHEREPALRTGPCLSLGCQHPDLTHYIASVILVMPCQPINSESLDARATSGIPVLLVPAECLAHWRGSVLNEQGACCGVPYIVTRSSLLRPHLALSLDKGDLPVRCVAETGRAARFTALCMGCHCHRC